MTMVIYHSTDFRATCDGDPVCALFAWVTGKYKKVASLDGDDLDEAYRLTNHIDTPWTANEGVTVFPGGHRSTSVGDLIKTSDGKYHLVKMSGFEEVNLLVELGAGKEWKL